MYTFELCNILCGDVNPHLFTPGKPEYSLHVSSSEDDRFVDAGPTCKLIAPTPSYQILPHPPMPCPVDLLPLTHPSGNTSCPVTMKVGYMAHIKVPFLARLFIVQSDLVQDGM